MEESLSRPSPVTCNGGRVPRGEVLGLRARRTERRARGRGTAFPGLGQAVPTARLRREEGNEGWAWGCISAKLRAQRPGGTALTLLGVRAGLHVDPRSRSSEGVPHPRSSGGTRSVPPPLPSPLPSPRPARNPTFAPAPGASREAGRRGPRAARPFDVRRHRCDWTVACDVRGLRWARVLRQPQRQPRLGLRLPGI